MHVPAYSWIDVACSTWIQFYIEYIIYYLA